MGRLVRGERTTCRLRFSFGRNCARSVKSHSAMCFLWKNISQRAAVCGSACAAKNALDEHIIIRRVHQLSLEIPRMRELRLAELRHRISEGKPNVPNVPTLLDGIPLHASSVPAVLESKWHPPNRAPRHAVHPRARRFRHLSLRPLLRESRLRASGLRVSSLQHADTGSSAGSAVWRQALSRCLPEPKHRLGESPATEELAALDRRVRLSADRDSVAVIICTATRSWPARHPRVRRMSCRSPLAQCPP